MSFGWSAGDIVVALQLLNTVVIALKDTGEASSDYQDISYFLNILSVTLQHLKALQTTPLNPDLTKNLKKHCTQIQEPLTAFHERISSRFERDLGAESTRLRFLTAGRKIQWALSTSKEVKKLQENIGGSVAAIGIVLSQQIVQTTLQMPSEIQARIAHMIDTAVDTRINPVTLAVHREVAALAVAEEGSSKLIEGAIRDVGKNNMEELQKHSGKINLDLENKFSTLSITQEACAGSIVTIVDQSRKILEGAQCQAIENRTASKDVQEMISNLSARQSQSTNLVLRGVRQEGQETALEIRNHTRVFREQTLSLHQKLDRMTWLAETVKDRMGNLSIAQQSALLTTTNSEIERAIDNIQRGIWLLVSALHILIRELIQLLAPHVVAIYRTSIQPLLLCGDHFLFEDAIGRRKWLPCVQFQHWKNFYHLLIDTFQGEVGLSRILNGQFVVLNGFNEVPIHKKAWRAGIQPKSRVAMAILLESAVKKGRCANPSCPGQLDFGKDEVTRVCPICGKHLSTLKDVTDDEEFGSETTFSFDFGNDIQIPILKATTDQIPRSNDSKDSSTSEKIQPSFKVTRNPLTAIDIDVAAYKRVIWQESNDIVEIAQGSVEQRGGKRPPRRSRGTKVRQKSALRTRKTEPSVLPELYLPPPPRTPSPFREPDTPQSNTQRPQINILKCIYCRRSRQDCVPVDREWPGTRCDRCISKALSCSSLLGYRKQQSQDGQDNDMAMPLRPSGKTTTVNSGPSSLYNPPPLQLPCIIDRPPSHPQSALSTSTTKSSELNTVLVLLSFKGKGKRLLPLDLSKNGNEIIAYLEPHIFKISGKQLDRSIHGMAIASLKEEGFGSCGSSLSEDTFDCMEAIMVGFMRENRTGGVSKKPEFRLDIGSLR